MLIILIKHLTTKSYNRRTSGDCGTSGPSCGIISPIPACQRGHSPLVCRCVHQSHFNFADFSSSCFPSCQWKVACSFIMNSFLSNLTLVSIDHCCCASEAKCLIGITLFVVRLPVRLVFWPDCKAIYTFINTDLIPCMAIELGEISWTATSPCDPDLHFLARRDECHESYCRTVSVGVSVSVRVHKNFNLAYNSWTTIGRAFIFHMCIPCDKTFPWVPQFFT